MLHLHEHGYLHRDLKSANLLVGDGLELVRQSCGAAGRCFHPLLAAGGQACRWLPLLGCGAVQCSPQPLGFQ